MAAIKPLTWKVTGTWLGADGEINFTRERWFATRHGAYQHKRWLSRTASEVEITEYELIEKEV